RALPTGHRGGAAVDEPAAFSLRNQVGETIGFGFRSSAATGRWRRTARRGPGRTSKCAMVMCFRGDPRSAQSANRALANKCCHCALMGTQDAVLFPLSGYASALAPE